MSYLPVSLTQSGRSARTNLVDKACSAAELEGLFVAFLRSILGKLSRQSPRSHFVHVSTLDVNMKLLHKFMHCIAAS